MRFHTANGCLVEAVTDVMQPMSHLNVERDGSVHSLQRADDHLQIYEPTKKVLVENIVL